MFKIFTEAGYSKGFGHFSRISGICDRLADQRIDFSLFIDADDVARRLIDRDYVKFESWLDETRIRELIKKDDIVLIDSYYYNVEFLDIIIDSCSKVIVIDDNKRLDYHDAVIINPNYFGEFLQYPQNRNNEYYLGHEYTLLRSEFIPDDKKTVKKDVERVLITMGGSDVANATHRVMKYMHDISESTALDVVVTEAYENLSEVNEVKRKGDSIITGATAGQMAELMRKADFAISSAGGTSNELIKMMCPSVFIVVADNQLLNMRYLLENELAEIFTLDAMDNIKTMFDFEKRRRIVEKLSEKKTDKNAADLIIKIVSQNGD